MNQKIAVILLNYKHQNDTIKCAMSLKKCNFSQKLSFYIVDNSSADTKLSKFDESIKKYTYLPQKSNLGFAKSINIGIKKALGDGADYLLIINPDVVVHDDFPKLLTNFKNPKVYVVAPAIRHSQNNKTAFGLNGHVNWKTGTASHTNIGKILSKSQIDSQFVTFACVFLSKKSIEKTGLIDERYFMYCEDVDYCLSVKINKGKIILDPRVIVDHKTSSSFNKPTGKLPISFISQIKFISKWLPPQKRVVPILYNLFHYFYLYLLWTYHYEKNKRSA